MTRISNIIYSHLIFKFQFDQSYLLSAKMLNFLFKYSVDAMPFLFFRKKRININLFQKQIKIISSMMENLEPQEILFDFEKICLSEKLPIIVLDFVQSQLKTLPWLWEMLFDFEKVYFSHGKIFRFSGFYIKPKSRLNQIKLNLFGTI